MIGREALLALIVLALLFLNFGHQPVQAASAWQVLGSDSFCGDPLSPSPADHAPCHACRIGSGADVPPVPGAILPVVFAIEPALHIADETPGILRLPFILGPDPRGPPALG